MIGKGATPSFFSIANYNYTLTLYSIGEYEYLEAQSKVIDADIIY